MKSFTYTVQDELGIHARPAGMLVKEAKKYITVAIEHSLDIGKGVGPTNHFYALFEKAGLKYE